MMGVTMKKIPTMFLQVVVVLIGIAAIAFMLWEPRVEGRNVNSTLFQIYFNDPFLAYAYIGSIPFFLGLYQTFKILGYVRENKAISQATAKAVRTIKYCAAIIVGVVAAPVAYLFIVRPGDDIAGGVFMGLLIISISIIVSTTAVILERIVQDALVSHQKSSK